MADYDYWGNKTTLKTGADTSKGAPQVVAPASKRGGRVPPGSALIEGGKIVRKFVDENLLKTRQHRGGVK